MNKKILPYVTTAQAILILVAANLVAMGYMISLLTYSHDTGAATQQELITLVNNQGNLSAQQRQQLLNLFFNVEQQGGFATSNATTATLDEIVKLEQILLQDRALMFKNSDVQDHKRLVQINQTQHEILSLLGKH